MKNDFKNPDRKYSSKTFWSWNGTLDDEDSKEQINFFHKMGLSGFYMHPRDGFCTEYLSEDYFHGVQTCIDEAKKLGMKAELYDEDGYPSGYGGGIVSQEAWAEEKMLMLVPDGQEIDAERRPEHLMSFEIALDESGNLKDCSTTDENKSGENIWHAYLCRGIKSGWVDNGTYIDTLNPKAMERFLSVTHEKYKERFGGEFGKTMTASFTDEPHYPTVSLLSNPFNKKTCVLPWTEDFNKGFKEKYGFDILQKLPEIIWNGEESRYIRYCFYKYLEERFETGFFEPYGKWCRENGLDFVGHTFGENRLSDQSICGGECMRIYKHFDIPGMDVLLNQVELTTAKQVQSVVHQMNKKGMMSEMYGVTNWDFDMRGEKFGGDWQAALGVTERVLHLSWYTMKHRAKTDCPASLGYQQPWCKEYSYLENHFTRLNSVLTRGRPIVKIGVIHPIESWWLYGENETAERKKIQASFDCITEWLLNNTLDFDFINEEQLPQLYKKSSTGLQVGSMNYDAVIIPNIDEIRTSTLEILDEYIEGGGKVIFAGNCPKYIDGKKSDKAAEIYNKSIRVQMTEYDIVKALETERVVSITDMSDIATDNLIYSLSKDNDDLWLFVARSKYPEYSDAQKPQNIRLTVDGEYIPTLYDTLDGEIYGLSFEHKSGKTLISYPLDTYESMLIKLENKADNIPPFKEEFAGESMTVCQNVKYTLSEENPLVLDFAKYSFDGKEFFDKEYIMKISEICKKHFGYLNEDYIKHERVYTKPWIWNKYNEITKHIITLEFEVESEIDVELSHFACEEISKLYVNGQRIELDEDGYFCDKAIKKYRMPRLNKGINKIIVEMPYSIVYGLESCYLLGNFGVRLNGSKAVITNLPDMIGFSTLTMQNMPFYGADITYHIPIETNGEFEVKVPVYRGGAVKVTIDGEDKGIIAFAPYTLKVSDVTDGKHTLSLTLLGNRYNTFGGLHNYSNPSLVYTPNSMICYGTGYWNPKGDAWGDGYRLRDFGILTAPIIKK